MAAEEPSALRTPRDVDEAREILARAFKVSPDKVAERFELDEEEFEAAVRRAISASLDQKGPFLFHWARAVTRRERSGVRYTSNYNQRPHRKAYLAALDAERRENAIASRERRRSMAPLRLGTR